MSLIGKNVSQIVKIKVESECEVYGEIIESKRIGDEFFHMILKVDGKITDVSGNSIEVLRYKWTEKGINAKQWFSMKEFNELFEIKF